MDCLFQTYSQEIFCPGTAETFSYVCSTYNGAVGTFYFGYYVASPGRQDYLIRSIQDDDPRSDSQPAFVTPAATASPGILKAFVDPVSRNNTVLLLTVSQLLRLVDVGSPLLVGQSFPFNIGNRAVSMDIVNRNVFIVGVNVPTGILPANATGAYGNYLASVPLVNDADRWRGELLDPSINMAIANSAIVLSAPNNGSVMMRSTPIIPCGSNTYIFLQGASTGPLVLEGFVYNSYPIKQIAKNPSVVPVGDRLLSVTCVDGTTTNTSLNGVILLMNTASAGDQYILFMDNTGKVSPKIPETPYTDPNQPNVDFKMTSIQTGDKQYFNRLIFGFDKRQNQVNQGAFFGYFQPKSYLLSDILSFLSPNQTCNPNFYWKMATNACVQCDYGSISQPECTATTNNSSSDSNNGVPLPIKIALAILIPFTVILVGFLMYGYWQRRQESIFEAKSGDNSGGNGVSRSSSRAKSLFQAKSLITLIPSSYSILQKS